MITAVIVPLYLLLLVLAIKSLIAVKASKFSWAVLTVLNIVLLVMAYVNIREGYRLDANQSSGNSWSMPLFGLVILATMAYYCLILFRHQKHSRP